MFSCVTVATCSIPKFALRSHVLEHFHMKNKCTNSTEEAKASLDGYLGVKEEVHENFHQRTVKLQNSWKRNRQMRSTKQKDSWKRNSQIGSVAAELVRSPSLRFHPL